MNQHISRATSDQSDRRAFTIYPAALEHLSVAGDVAGSQNIVVIRCNFKYSVLDYGGRGWLGICLRMTVQKPKMEIIVVLCSGLGLETFKKTTA